MKSHRPPDAEPVKRKEKEPPRRPSQLPPTNCQCQALTVPPNVQIQPSTGKSKSPQLMGNQNLQLSQIERNESKNNSSRFGKCRNETREAGMRKYSENKEGRTIQLGKIYLNSVLLLFIHY